MPSTTRSTRTAASATQVEPRAPKAAMGSKAPARKRAAVQTTKQVAARKTSAAAPAAAPKPKPIDTVASKSEARTKPKEKLVRDSFTMPRDDHALIAQLKHRSLISGRVARKSELLRAGLHALKALPAAALQTALESLTPLKVGRPKADTDRR